MDARVRGEGCAAIKMTIGTNGRKGAGDIGKELTPNSAAFWARREEELPKQAVNAPDGSPAVDFIGQFRFF